jgi:zinc protease
MKRTSLLLGALFTLGVQANEKRVFKHVLENGLTILVCPVPGQQNVSCNIAYNVGSKDERSGEKGLAHFIEHMIFKGTDKLSESDIAALTHLYSGDSNAATSFDMTHYFFSLPPENYKEAFAILADCMENCRFDADILNAELKAVIQEMKKNRDDYQRTLIQKMITAIFPDHPYHYPIIGYKHDLWNLSRENLLNFYKKHYFPARATLIVVGNVLPEEIFDEAARCFGPIKNPQDAHAPESRVIISDEQEAHQVVLYRDTPYPYLVLAWIIPGLKDKKHHLTDAISHLLTNGKLSRLHSLLVDDLKIATSINSSALGLFDRDLFLIHGALKDEADIPAVEQLIQNSLVALAHDGITHEEFLRAQTHLKSVLYDLQIHNDEQASLIAESFLAFQDEEYFFKDHLGNHEDLSDHVKNYAAHYLRPALMHEGILLPISDEEKPFAQKWQKRSDDLDTQILEKKVRTSDIQPIQWAKNVQPAVLQKLAIAIPEQCELANGLRVFFHHDATIPKISALLTLSANAYHDCPEKPGLYNMMCMMLKEGGTRKFSGHEFASLCESHAIDIKVAPGQLSMDLLAQNAQQGFELLSELVKSPSFAAEELEKVRFWCMQHYQKFMQNPIAQAHQIAADILFAGHPKQRNLLGTPASIGSITRQDLIDFHARHFIANGAALFISGDLSAFSVEKMMTDFFGDWQQGERQLDPEGHVRPVASPTIHLSMERDQTVLCFAGRSVKRTDDDFEALLLYEQIFGKGMHSQLFKLREQTGAFYSINGTLIGNTDNYPGFWQVITQVSHDRIYEAKTIIRHVINDGIESITQQDLESARRAINVKARDLYQSNAARISTWAFLTKYNLPWDYYVIRGERLKSLSLDQVKKAVKKVLSLDQAVTITVGRAIL